MFNSFAGMIETIPVGAIVRTLERAQRMIEEDLACQRPVPLIEAESILNFCYYVGAVRQGPTRCFLSLPLPAAHYALYSQTLERLIAARQLPPDAKVKFESAAIGTGTMKQLFPVAGSFPNQRLVENAQQPFGGERF